VNSGLYSLRERVAAEQILHNHRKSQLRGRTSVRTFLIDVPPICRASAAISFNPDPVESSFLMPRPLSATVKRPSP
jgi:hypothetical protein